MSLPQFPKRIVTPRLVIRCKSPADAPLLKEALDSSLDHLRPWMPWAHDEPSSIEVLEARLAKFHADFEAGRDWPFGIFSGDETQILGGTGLHPRGAVDEIEIGYWIRASAEGHGYVTESASALTKAAFESPVISRVIIKCDPANTRSAAVPKRLGYHLMGLTPTAHPTSARTHDMIWQMTRQNFSGL
jgi:RimJ/RimL family protein N-acetyltransferase